jgi:hypothetical protein
MEAGHDGNTKFPVEVFGATAAPPDSAGGPRVGGRQSLRGRTTTRQRAHRILSPRSTARWFTLATARSMILPSQAALLDRLRDLPGDHQVGAGSSSGV